MARLPGVLCSGATLAAQRRRPYSHTRCPGSHGRRYHPDRTGSGVNLVNRVVLEDLVGLVGGAAAIQAGSGQAAATNDGVVVKIRIGRAALESRGFSAPAKIASGASVFGRGSAPSAG